MIVAEERAASLGLRAGVPLIEQTGVIMQIAVRLDGTLAGRAARQVARIAGTDGLASSLRLLGSASFLVLTEIAFHHSEAK